MRVNMVVDSVGGSGMKDEDVQRLKSAGCRIAQFNSPTWYSLEEVNYRTHRKILVVDGEIGFTGGVGVRRPLARARAGQGALARHPGPDARADRAAARGRVLRELHRNCRRGHAGARRRRRASCTTAGASMVVRSSPTGGSNDLKRLYLLAIASARRTIDITTPYFVTDESSEWALRDAVARGVKIRILVEGDITDAMPVKYASRQAYDHLLALGIEIYEYQPTMMHTKTLVVDGTWSMFGSANFDNRSLELNDELNVAVTIRALAARFLEDFEQGSPRRRHASTCSSGAGGRSSRRSRELFWSYFGEIF